MNLKRSHFKLLVVLGASLAGLFAVALVLRLLGLVIPFKIPTAAMAPTLKAGDCVLMEGISYLVRQPRRGDVLVFRTDGISGIPARTIYTKRLVGLPGEKLRIEDGKLYINDKHEPLQNAEGEISYVYPQSYGGNLFAGPGQTVTVPPDGYFVLGDNSTNSLDSRFWGFVPAGNVKGRLVLYYWPPDRMGSVK